MFWQQSTISRPNCMEGVRGLAVTQVDSSQRGQIVGVDKIAALHLGGGQMGAQHLPKSVAGQPGEKSRRYTEAAQANGNIEARSTGMRFVREMPTNRSGRCQVDERIAGDHDSRVGRHAELPRRSVMKTTSHRRRRSTVR